MVFPVIKFAYTSIWLALIFLIIGICDCLEQSPDLSYQNYPSEFWIDFPHHFLQPDSITCGPASTIMILSAYHKNISFNEVKRKTRTVWFQYQGKDIGMTSPGLIASTLNSFGISSQVKQGSLNYLKYQVSQQKPCIVLVRSSETLWHYMIVIGYNADIIYLADPGRETIRAMPTDIFQNSWDWKSDTYGESCQQTFLITLLKLAEVYPNTMIFPENGIHYEQQVNSLPRSYHRN